LAAYVTLAGVEDRAQLVVYGSKVRVLELSPLGLDRTDRQGRFRERPVQVLNRAAAVQPVVGWASAARGYRFSWS